MSNYKSDCIDNMYSDKFSNGTHMLYHMISILFTSMLIHGVSPGDLLLSTLVPIPKNKRGNKWNSNNYRQIAINSILAKILIVLFWMYNMITYLLIFYNLVLKAIHPDYLYFYSIRHN